MGAENLADQVRDQLQNKKLHARKKTKITYVKSSEINLQHKVFLENMLHTMTSRGHSICIPLTVTTERLKMMPNLEIKVSSGKTEGMLLRSAHISSTHPNVLSVSGSFFIFKETFIHVGAIFSSTS